MDFEGKSISGSRNSKYGGLVELYFLPFFGLSFFFLDEP